MPRKSRLLIATLLVALLASLYANYRLLNRGIADYTDAQAIRLDPYNLGYFDGEKDKTYAHPLVVFYGDSRVAQWPAPNVPGLTFANRGIGNHSSAQILGRFDAHLRPLNPDVVVLQLGINDLKGIPVLPERKAQIIANLKANITEVVQRSRAMGARVILTTIFPTANAVPLERRPVWSDEVNVGVREVNEHIRALAGEGVIILDAYVLLSDEQGFVTPEYSQDLLHANARAYEVLNSELVKLLQ
jgi:lysophospholipase L1-like esterase